MLSGDHEMLSGDHEMLSGDHEMSVSGQPDIPASELCNVATINRAVTTIKSVVTAAIMELLVDIIYCKRR